MPETAVLAIAWHGTCICGWRKGESIMRLSVGSSKGRLWGDPRASCCFQNASGDFARLDKSRHSMCCCCCCLLLFEPSSACLVSHPFVVVVHSYRERLQAQQVRTRQLLTSWSQTTEACKLSSETMCLLYSLEIWRYARGKIDSAHVLHFNRTGQHRLSVLFKHMLAVISAMHIPPNLQAIPRTARCPSGHMQFVQQAVCAEGRAKMTWRDTVRTPAELTLLAWS